jgi:hypothetical protein
MTPRHIEQCVIYRLSNLASKQILVFLLVSNKQKRFNAYYINNKLISPAPGALNYHLKTLVLQGIQHTTHFLIVEPNVSKETSELQECSTASICCIWHQKNRVILLYTKVAKSCTK